MYYVLCIIVTNPATDLVQRCTLYGNAMHIPKIRQLHTATTTDLA